MEKRTIIRLVLCALIFLPSFLGAEEMGLSDTALPQALEGDGSKGVFFSLLVPGGGQFYNAQYLKGGTVLAFEAVTGGIAYHWAREARTRDRRADLLRDSVNFYKELQNNTGLDESALTQARNGQVYYSILTSQAQFQSREARFRSYNALSWMGGGYVFSVLDALEHSGILTHEVNRDPAMAAGLAAIPGLGLGQIYNGSYSKAGLMIMTQVSLGLTAYNYHRLMRDASRQYSIMQNPNSDENMFSSEFLRYWKGRYDSAFSNRNTYLWYSLFFYLYSIVDAVVDAHLSDFPEKTRILPDLALSSEHVALSFSFDL
ncbi:hypothetical protein CHISP_0493 [Chitinispirillum alkaliphilum]|nr:hypothetical protein CHISP_0493 [Chitinispirillum alkaliphilum]